MIQIGLAVFAIAKKRNAGQEVSKLNRAIEIDVGVVRIKHLTRFNVFPGGFVSERPSDGNSVNNRGSFNAKKCLGRFLAVDACAGTNRTDLFPAVGFNSYDRPDTPMIVVGLSRSYDNPVRVR